MRKERRGLARMGARVEGESWARLRRSKRETRAVVGVMMKKRRNMGR